MMDAVRCYPTDRPAFESQSAANGQEILNPFGGLIAAVCEKTVISHSDAEAPGDPPKESRQQERFPRKEKQRRDGAEVECGHEKTCGPIDWLAKCFVALEDAHKFGGPRCC